MESSNVLTRRQFMGRTIAAGAGGLVAASLAAADSDSTEKWRIGCYTRPWASQDYTVALDSIAEAGFKYVGLMTAKSVNNLVISVDTTASQAEEIAKEIAKRDLEVLSVYGGGIPVDKSLNAGIEGLRRLIDNCAACGTKSLLMGGTSNAKLYDPYYKAIAACCDYAAERGMEIVVKPHGGLNATGPQCRKTVEMVGHKNFRIWYDPGNMFYYSDGKLDPVVDAPTVDGLVTGMCVKDYRHPKDVAVTPGNGRVDFARVLAILKKGGFTSGSLVIECVEKGDVKQSIAEARKARRFLEGLLGQAKTQSTGNPTPKSRFKAGVAVADITPPTGYRMSGYFSERLATGTLDPLKAKAIVLADGDSRAAVVCCDIIGLCPDVSSRARRQASKKTGIPAENIVLAAVAIIGILLSTEFLFMQLAALLQLVRGRFAAPGRQAARDGAG